MTTSGIDESSFASPIRDGMLWQLSCVCFDRWHVMPSPKEYAIIGISDGAVEVMVCLRDCLHLVTGAVSPELRGDIWSKIIAGLDSVVLQEVSSGRLI